MPDTEDYGYDAAATIWYIRFLDEFQKLVIAIAFHRLRQLKRKTGVEEDMKNAFLEAIKEVDSAIGGHCSNYSAATVQIRIKELIEKYKTQTP